MTAQCGVTNHSGQQVGEHHQEGGAKTETLVNKVS